MNWPKSINSERCSVDGPLACSAASLSSDVGLETLICSPP